MKRRAWTLLIPALAGAGLPLLLVVSAHRHAAQVLERQEREIQRLLGEYRDRARARPCAFGDPLPGNSAPLEDRVNALLGSMTEDERKTIIEARRSARDPDDRVLAVILAKYAPAIQSLRTGLRRSPAGSLAIEGLPRDEGLEQARLFFLTLIEHHQRCGRSAEAFECYFLLLGMLQDQAWDTGVLSDLRSVEENVQSAYLILEDHTLSVAELDRLLPLLGRLERSRPTLLDEINVEDCKQRMLVFDPEQDERMAGSYRTGVYRPIQPTWRTLWSRNIARAASLRELEDHFNRRREIASRPWQEIRPAFTAYMETEVGRFVEPPAGHGLQLERCELYETYAMAARTLLRAAMEVAREDLIHDRFPSAIPGAPCSPWTGLPLVVKEEAVTDLTPIFGRSIEIGRRR